MGQIQERFVLFVEKIDIPKYEISKMIGVSPSLVGKITKGDNAFSVNILEKILEVFPRLNPMWLLRGEGTMYLPETVEQPAQALPTDIEKLIEKKIQEALQAQTNRAGEA
jgi:transcriptional regulator with XRE-family HTH domain